MPERSEDLNFLLDLMRKAGLDNIDAYARQEDQEQPYQPLFLSKRAVRNIPDLVAKLQVVMSLYGIIKPTAFFEFEGSEEIEILPLDELNDDVSIPMQAGIAGRMAIEFCMDKHPGQEVLSLGYVSEVWLQVPAVFLYREGGEGQEFAFVMSRQAEMKLKEQELNPGRSAGKREMLAIALWHKEPEHTESYYVPIKEEGGKRTFGKIIGPVKRPSHLLDALVKGVKAAPRGEEAAIAEMDQDIQAAWSRFSPAQRKDYLRLIEQAGVPADHIGLSPEQLAEYQDQGGK